MYKVLPNIRTGFWDQLPGALFTTVIWLLYSFFYAFYIDHFSNFSFTYGSLAAIVFMMLWLYSCMKIILIGGEINMYLAERR
jgi:membrane protein